MAAFHLSVCHSAWQTWVIGVRLVSRFRLSTIGQILLCDREVRQAEISSVTAIYQRVSKRGMPARGIGEGQAREPDGDDDDGLAGCGERRREHNVLY